ncbi:MAG: hypothetical protein ACI8XO_002563 [Verrucomicrobiales bacterium]|jgi:hypothetical protein
MKKTKRFCDGVDRRSFLRVGTAAMLGANLTLPRLLQSAPAANPKSDISVIFVFLHGGLSTIDTFDLKPDAPANIRGEFGSIPTNIPGIRIGEHLERTAQQMDKISLIRSFTHSDAGHGSADHYMLTGYHTLAGFNANLIPNNQRPCHGSIIAHKLGPRGSVPAYVCLPTMHRSGGPAYLGATSAAFAIEADPSSPGFSVPDLVPPMTVDAERLEARAALLAGIDRYHKSTEVAANRSARTVGVFKEKAFDLMTSPAAKKAFDIGAEPEKLRDEYGRTTLGQSCLMARRLVEGGVRCVTIDHSNWDTHDANARVLRHQLPMLDHAMAALFRDLDDRGMLDSTMVVVTGEFGRTPRINANGGRDHWSKCFTVALGGGGIQGGRVIGKSDKYAEEPADDPVSPEDFAATMYRQFGIDAREELMTPEGRPIPIVNNGSVIEGLL